MTIPHAAAPATRTDRFRQLATLVTFVAAFAMNGAANALPLNGQTTGQISDGFRVFVTPAGFTFAIWGLIYLGQLAFLAHVLRPSRAADPLLRRLGLLPAAAAAFNAAWIVAWHWNAYPVSLALMAGLLLSLIGVYLRGDLGGRARPGSGASRTERWLVQVPFSVYLGWITLATILNVAAVGAWLSVPTGGLALPLIAAAVLVVGFVVAATAILVTADVAYAAVIAWAYLGIFAKESAAATPYVPVVAGAVVAGVAIVLVAALVRSRARGREGRPASTDGRIGAMTA